MPALIDRILKGAKPGDLPLEVITKHRFVANVRAARQIGLTLPPWCRRVPNRSLSSILEALRLYMRTSAIGTFSPVSGSSKFVSYLGYFCPGY